MPSRSEIERQVLEPESENSQLRTEIERLGTSVPKDVDDIAGESGFADRQLDQREYSLRSMLDNMPAMIGYWDKNLHNRFCNKAYSKWFGISAEQLLGKHIRELLGETIFNLNLPYIESVLLGQPQQFERTIPMPDGSGDRYTHAQYIPDIIDGVVQGFFVQVSDITAIKQAERDLRESEARYRTVVQDQAEVISRLRGDGTYIFVNEVFLRFFGKLEAELIGFKWNPLVYPDDLARVTKELSMLSPANPVVMIENRVYSGDGQVHWMQFSNRGTFDSTGQLIEIQSVGRDISDRKQAEEQIRILAFYDALTKLPNRRLLSDRLAQGMAISKRSGRFGALMFLDLDNFKQLNDTHGHQVGDFLLIEVAHRISGCARESDTVARFGGDEFVVMLSELDKDKAKSTARASIVAEKIRTALAEPYLLAIGQEGKADRFVEHHCSTSIGIVLFINHEASAEDIIKWADMAMYQAKDGGRNLIRFHDTKN
jgi:diguanylate cyclase (GGDEF)-like protein/PAS domain S-box-containing protein